MSKVTQGNTRAGTQKAPGKAGSLAFKNPTLPLAVVVASTRWDEPPRMRHHISRQLTRFFNVLVIEYLPSPANVPSEGDTLSQVSDTLAVWSPQNLLDVNSRLHVNLPWVHAAVNKRDANTIRKFIAENTSGHRLLFNFVYDFPELMKLDCFEWRCYVCVDEFPRMWRSSERGSALKRAYQSRLWQSYENRVAGAADCCFTPHTMLGDKLRRVCPNVYALHHATEATRTDALDCRNEDGGHDKVIKVAFLGYIHYRLLDSWLLRVLEQADMKLSLIGPVHAGYDIETLQTFPNFKHVAPVTEAEIIPVLSEADVLIMPYDPRLPEVEVLTTTSKLYQYVSSLKPIVISNLPNFIELPEGTVYRATSAHDFIKQIRHAKQADCDEYRTARKKLSEQNTWHSRGDTLFERLKEELGPSLWAERS